MRWKFARIAGGVLTLTAFGVVYQFHTNQRRNWFRHLVGARVSPTGNIVFSAVKLDETCP